MDKRYDHTKHEEKIYSLWEKSGAFVPRIDKKKKPFTIIMPPPNANDPLHIGHAREVATQDILIRFHRMKGAPTLWLPGADHAGIETQYVYEKRLAKKGKSRFNFDRNTLYKMIWNYVQENTKIMKRQLRQLGASCDWTRFKFTLDPDIIKIVYETFKKLYDDGLIYRGERIVNYCPRCGTTFSQLEVNHIERDDDFYYIDYGPVTIATTRPETIFADVAVAVNPKDKKLKKLIGKSATLPIVNRSLPIIADSLVDPEFGTGALKITPAHDATDFEIGEKHKLPKISVIDKSGRMVNTPAKYIGLKAEKAREEVVKDLKELKRLKKIETIRHTVGTCYKHKSLIEPIISKQWFLKVEPLVKLSLSAINKRELKFTAKRYEKIAKHWLKNLRDWNISRQIAWGMRIPAWRCEKCLEWMITKGGKPKNCSACKHNKLTQDKDTFDTWFSSGQWPYATLKTTKPGDFEYFYPTSVMDPSYDILPFWVIRMIMLGIYSTDNVPFKEVLLHGLVRDEAGVKISKSKGNVIDPIDMVNKYGADALRIASIWGSLVENDNSLLEDNIRGQRNFSNKVWNIARFVLSHEQNRRTGEQESRKKSVSRPQNQLSRRPRTENEDDRWIMNELKITTKKVTRALDKYRLNEAAEEIYDFIWHKFADVCLEKVKSRIMNLSGPVSDSLESPTRGETSMGRGHESEIKSEEKDKEDAIRTLYYVLNTSLHLLHPFMPFVTEAIYQQGFAQNKNDLLITSPWPK